jgi:hypothetical protein
MKTTYVACAIAVIVGVSMQSLVAAKNAQSDRGGRPPCCSPATVQEVSSTYQAINKLPTKKLAPEMAAFVDGLKPLVLEASRSKDSNVAGEKVSRYLAAHQKLLADPTNWPDTNSAELARNLSRTFNQPGGHDVAAKFCWRCLGEFLGGFLKALLT